MNYHRGIRIVASLLLALALFGCGHKQAPLAPPESRVGPAGAPPGGPHIALPRTGAILSEAILVLADPKSIDEFVDKEDLIKIDALTIEETTYFLVGSAQGGPIELEIIRGSDGVSLVEEHNRIWAPEFDRGGLSFDDTDSWRSVNEYEAQPVLERIGLNDAVKVSQEQSEKIAILDTGIEANHALFIGAILEFGKNFTVHPPRAGVEDIGNSVDDDGDLEKDEGVGHGTHVAGIVHTGAPKATLIIAKVLDDEGWGTAFGLALGTIEAVNKGADVINMSLGLVDDDPMIRHLIGWVGRRGVALVASAGNQASSEPQYPAAYEEAVSVTAVDDQDVRALFSNFGTTVGVAAPGVDIISAIPKKFGKNRYAIASGTSMAAPFISAAVSLAHAEWPQLSPREAASHVLLHSVPIGAQNPSYPSLLGSGRVDFLAPLQTSP